MVSFLLLKKVTQFLIIIFIGFLLVKFKIVKGKDSAVLSKISLYLLIPSSIISAFQIDKPFVDVAIGLILAFAVAFAIHIVLMFIDFTYTRIVHPSPTERASVIYSNAGNLIIPIVSYVLGNEWVVYSIGFLSVQLIFIWTHCKNIFDGKKEGSIKKIIFNVNIISIVAGLVLMLLQIKLPTIIVDATSSLSTMLGPVGMLITGMLLAEVDFKTAFKNIFLYRTILMRMILIPIIILFLLKSILLLVKFPEAEKILFISFLAAITPTASTVTQFSQIYNDDVDFAVTINVVTTIICVVTMPVLAWFF